MQKQRNVWTMTEARARFYELFRAAQKEPQIITVRGKPKYHFLPASHPVIRKYEAERAAKSRVLRKKER